MTYRDAFGVVGRLCVSTDGGRCNALLISAANTSVEGTMKLDCVRVKITEVGRRALQ